MLTRSYPARALSAGGVTTPLPLEPAHLSVLPSWGAADERRHHPGRGDPYDAPPSKARGRSATDCPGSCWPSNVRLGRLQPTPSRVASGATCVQRRGVSPVSTCAIPCAIAPPPAFPRWPGGWPMDNVDARCHVWSGILPPARATKKRTWTSPLCRRLPVCAVSGCV